VKNDVTLFSAQDFAAFDQGRHYRLWEKLGCHVTEADGQRGAVFGVWAPGSRAVHVVGDFNEWDGRGAPLTKRSSGVWEGFVAGAAPGHRYKFRVKASDGSITDRSDPFARTAEVPPASASVVWEDHYEWQDVGWMKSRGERNRLDAPMSIYEVHLGSWMRPPGGGFHSYREFAPLLAEHVEKTRFTHVELLPVMEHPFYGSWGYQVTGYFAPTSRYGSPADLKYLVDFLHQRGIGVILDWVPSHFPGDEHGLARFDGTHLFEYEDERLGFHPDWNSWIFDYSRKEVRSFLISSALFWLMEYHADGLRVDAVASMLYRDYSRDEDEWIPNVYGGRENLEAVELVRDLNLEVYVSCPHTQTIAEESTAWPGVSRRVEEGGLGFGMKWDMGWMNDILRYMALDPVRRRRHHDDLTFRHMYAFSENFVLPFSHDEVVHGKGSLWRRMAGNEEEKFANLRVLYGSLYGQPGKKLLFMGAEIGQRSEWDHEAQVDWELLNDPRHAGILRWVSDLNRLYRNEPALHELDCDSAGFEWVAPDDSEQNVVSFLRRSRDGRDAFLIVCNFSATPRREYRVGVPTGGTWRERLNSDATCYGGQGWGNLGEVEAEKMAFHGREQSLSLTLPPLSAVFLQADDEA
jgi:1,4-alpha-glucan branching enzyme